MRIKESFIRGKGDINEGEHAAITDGYITSELLVSVIIPVYNVSRYLLQCFDSVISQTYRNLEIIVIDDGSTDDSGSICDQYAEKDNRIHVIHTDNRGLASARNLGLENVSGEYISFIDSDDWIEPQTIEMFIGAALETEVDIVSARTCSEYVGGTVHRPMEKNDSHSYFGQDILSAFAEGKFGSVVWNKLYCVECFRDIRFPDGHNYEDVAIIWKIMKNLAESGGMVTALSDELIHFRVRKNSISHTYMLNNVADSWNTYLAKYEALPDYQDKLLVECFRPIRRMWMNYCGYSKEDKAEAQKIIQEMHSFSKKNLHRVMKGDYSKQMKLFCILTQSRSAATMWIGYCGGKLRRVLKGGKYKMFD